MIAFLKIRWAVIGDGISFASQRISRLFVWSVHIICAALGNSVFEKSSMLRKSPEVHGEGLEALSMYSSGSSRSSKASRKGVSASQRSSNGLRA